LGQYLNEGQDNKQVELLKKHECTGRPLGNETFIKTLEKKLGISLKKKKPGPKKRIRGN
jgi:putative transposase